MSERIKERLARIWPFFLVFLLIYLAGLIYFWITSWTGANAITSRLAIGDSARAILTRIQAALSFIAIGSTCWFLLSPKRNWKHGLISLLPYIFTWCLSATVGANTSMTDQTVYKYCLFEEQSLEISGYFDLSPEQRNSPPPYRHPKTGEHMISCADAELRRKQILKERENQAKDEARAAIQREADAQAEAEQRRRTIKPTSIFSLYPNPNYELQVIETPYDFTYEEDKQDGKNISASTARYVGVVLKWRSESAHYYTYPFDAIVRMTSPPKSCLFGQCPPIVKQWASRGIIQAGTEGWASLGGQGNDEPGTWAQFPLGMWKVEVFVEDKLLVAGYFNLSN